MLSALVSVSPLAVGAWLFAPRTPAPRRDPATVPLFADGDTCTGPRLRTQTVPDLRAPGGEREAICGFVTVGTRHYAWTRHALFLRVDGESVENNGWVLIERSTKPLARVVALPSATLAVVDASGDLLANGGSSAHDDALIRFDLAVVDARRDRLAAPPSPLACLTTARAVALSVYKQHRHKDPGAFAVGLSIDALGRARRTELESKIATSMRAADVTAELARVEDALYLDDDGATFTEVWLEWTCDERVRSMTLRGLRAKRVQAIATSWFVER